MQPCSYSFSAVSPGTACSDFVTSEASKSEFPRTDVVCRAVFTLKKVLAHTIKALPHFLGCGKTSQSAMGSLARSGNRACKRFYFCSLGDSFSSLDKDVLIPLILCTHVYAEVHGGTQ